MLARDSVRLGRRVGNAEPVFATPGSSGYDLCQLHRSGTCFDKLSTNG